jgi:flagellar hook-length control protein FliK
MDYVSNAVQATSGSTTSVVPGSQNSNAASSGILNFNGLLQNATAAPVAAAGQEAAAGQTAATPLAQTAAVTANPTVQSAVGQALAGDTAARVTDTVTLLAANTHPLTLVSTKLNQQTVDADAVAEDAAVDTLQLTGDEPLPQGATTPQNLDKHLLVDAKAGAAAQVAQITDPNTKLAGAADAITADRGAHKLTPAADIVVSARGARVEPVVTQSLMPSASVTTTAAVAKEAGAVGLSTGSTEQPITVNTDGKTLPAQIFVHGRAVADAANTDPVARVTPVIGNSADARAQSAPAAQEIATTQVSNSNVTTALSTNAIAHGLVARQRNSAANDESASQISRGGNEARLLELNGVRTTRAITADDARAPLAITAAGDEPVRHINAVTLAATRENQSLRAAIPAVNQQQVTARASGVEMAQISSVDFAAAQIESAPASQGVSRISILEPGWTNQLGSDLRALVTRGSSTTQVQVSPAELGPLDIEVSVNRQELSVRILAMHGQTREMLEAALPRLREYLGQNYASVDVSVGTGSGNSSSGSSAHSHHSSGQAMAMMSDAQDGLRDSGATRESESNDNTTDAEVPVESDTPVPVNAPKPARGLVDAYA